jgi:hypothetical protein
MNSISKMLLKKSEFIVNNVVGKKKMKRKNKKITKTNSYIYDHNSDNDEEENDLFNSEGIHLPNSLFNSLFI